MLMVLILVLLNGVSSAKFDVECNNSSDKKLTVEPANDGVDGRYRVEWCTEPRLKNSETTWNIELDYNLEPMTKCPDDDIFRTKFHSHFVENVNITNFNCTNLCFSTSLDLIFNGSCYLLKTKLEHGSDTESPDYLKFYVTNEFPKEHFIQGSSHTLVRSSNKEELFVRWFLNFIPVTDFKMELCTVQTGNERQHCINVTDNCTVVGEHQSEVDCSLRAPYGRYTARLSHWAPWVSCDEFQHLIHLMHEFTHQAERAPREEGAGPAPWWALGALALALAAAALAAALCRRRPVPGWPPQAPKRAENAAIVRSARDKILLVYARDCAPVMRVAELLRKLLARATDDNVYDLFALNTWREAATAPGEWLRRAFTRDDVRVVLLQAPAAAQLYTSAAGPALALEQPLLGRRVVYAAPRAADALVSLALRLLHETAHTQPAHAYRKCYKAVISGLKVDLAPTITPLRWYELPKDVLLLLRDLDPNLFPQDSSQSPLPIDNEFKAELEDFYQAINDLLEYVKENPGYLNDEILCI